MRSRDFAVSLAAFITLAAGCDSSPSATHGMVTFALPEAAGPTFAITFAWRVRSTTGTTIASGSFDASDPNATASVSAKVPAGTGNSLMLIGSANDGVVCGGVSALFNVIPDQATSVDLPISCFGVGTGGAQSSLNAAGACPTTLTFSAAPAATPSAHFDLSVAPSNPATSGPLSYLWSAVTGSFSNSVAAQTGYDCGAPGGLLPSVLVVGNQMPQPCAVVATLPFLTCL
jgi:hypothetical protein